MTKEPAILALADGTIFEGRSIGASGQTNGEIVFNTSMTGYQEILTDPSYAKQIVTLTYPHIGNTGTNDEDLESDNIWCSGLVIRSLSPIESNWRKTNSLSEYLKQNNIIGISDIDTRKLTRIIRTKGAQSASIFAGNEIDQKSAILNANQFTKRTLFHENLITSIIILKIKVFIQFFKLIVSLFLQFIIPNYKFKFLKSYWIIHGIVKAIF